MDARPGPPRPAVAVTLLTQADCSLCEIAKEVLARVGLDHRLDVREVDLAGEEGRTLAMRHGVLFAPGVLIWGERFSYGRLSEKKLRLQLAQVRPPVTQRHAPP